MWRFSIKNDTVILNRKRYISPKLKFFASFFQKRSRVWGETPRSYRFDTALNCVVGKYCYGTGWDKEQEIHPFWH